MSKDQGRNIGAIHIKELRNQVAKIVLAGKLLVNCSLFNIFAMFALDV